MFNPFKRKVAEKEIIEKEVEVERIVSVSVKPEDVIMFTHRGKMSDICYNRMREQLQSLFPKNKVVVIEDDMKVNILSPEAK